MPYLENGTVIPHGLLDSNPSDFMRGFEKTYNNTALRLGVVVKAYPPNDQYNITKLSTEYDVIVIEQNQNRGVAPVTYKNCLSVDSFGSIADYLESNHRVQNQTNNQFVTNTKGQNGAIVLVLCLDATTGKGIILGGVNHPDRPTNLTTPQPQLYGEYNGVQIQVNPDGSTSLTFKGATDNNGNPTSPGQGNTVVQIATDGSFSIQHSTITLQLERSGNINITATANISITNNGTTNIIAQGVTTVDGSHINLGQSALEAVVKGDTFREIWLEHTHIGNLGVETSGPLQDIEPALSTHVSTE